MTTAAATAYSDPLALRAAEARALMRALDVRCPDALHWHAKRGVPCSPPSNVHRVGWVCIPRIELEITTRASREIAHRAEEGRERKRRRIERREENEARQRARITARIAAAAHLAQEEES
jgi:hypothetical protein